MAQPRAEGTGTAGTGRGRIGGRRVGAGGISSGGISSGGAGAGGTVAREPSARGTVAQETSARGTVAQETSARGTVTRGSSSGGAGKGCRPPVPRHTPYQALRRHDLSPPDATARGRMQQRLPRVGATSRLLPGVSSVPLRPM